MAVATRLNTGVDPFSDSGKAPCIPIYRNRVHPESSTADDQNKKAKRSVITVMPYASFYHSSSDISQACSVSEGPRHQSKPAGKSCYSD